MDLVILALIAACVVIAVQILRAVLGPKPSAASVAKFRVGDITEHSLKFHNGTDWSKPTLVAIQGKVYDVTPSNDKFGPDKPQHVYAGRECARALALDSLEPKEVELGSNLSGLEEVALERLKQQADHFAQVYDEVGTVVPMRDFSVAELELHDGRDAGKPMYLAIQGVVYDITAGKNFYGPGGVYPFAGKEVARAFAMLSTELSDCNDDLSGLCQMELDNLREWTDKFNWKYPIVGVLSKESTKDS